MVAAVHEQKAVLQIMDTLALECCQLKPKEVLSVSPTNEYTTTDVLLARN